jgi:hypothetical protein
MIFHILRQQLFEMSGNGLNSAFMDKVHGRLSVHVFTHRYGCMDNMV